MYVTISDDVRKSITTECKKLKAVPILISRVSLHDGDNYLYVVLAKRQTQEITEDTAYVVWLYNNSIGGLGTGRYMLSFQEALEVMSTKIK